MTKPEEVLLEILKEMLAEIRCNAMIGARIGKADRCKACRQFDEIERKITKLQEGIA